MFTNIRNFPSNTNFECVDTSDNYSTSKVLNLIWKMKDVNIVILHVMYNFKILTPSFNYQISPWKAALDTWIWLTDLKR